MSEISIFCQAENVKLASLLSIPKKVLTAVQHFNKRFPRSVPKNLSGSIVCQRGFWHPGFPFHNLSRSWHWYKTLQRIANLTYWIFESWIRLFLYQQKKGNHSSLCSQWFMLIVEVRHCNVCDEFSFAHRIVDQSGQNGMLAYMLQIETECSRTSWHFCYSAFSLLFTRAYYTVWRYGY